MEWLITTQQDAMGYALEEIRLLGDWAADRLFGGGVALVRGDSDLPHALMADPPVFIRHICPVHVRLELSGEGGLSELARAAADLASMLDVRKTFSVQSRTIGDEGMEYKRFDINEAVAGSLTALGFSLSVREPEQIISVALDAGCAYIGVSSALDNLSDWAGGAQRFKYEPDQISRAEFKLLEAISLFRVKITPGTALDLGAAPGGWTRVLRRIGFDVTAVDPAALDKSLASDTKITHYAGTAQEFMKDCKKRFDLIVNDMRMDALKSSELTRDAAAVLNDGGVALITLKLAQKHQLRQVRASLEILRSAYAIRGARQLFHNRSEVTVLLARLGDG